MALPRRLLARLLHRLDRSPLLGGDAVRLDLEAELLALMVLEGAKRIPFATSRESGVRYKAAPTA